MRRKTKVTRSGIGYMLSKTVTSPEDKLRSDPTGILSDSNCTTVLVLPQASVTV